MIADCPCCGYKNALAITAVDGRILYCCHNGCDKMTLWQAVQEGSVAVPKEVFSYVAPRPVNRNLGEYVRRLWRESVPMAGTPVETYLLSRGITQLGIGPLLSLRFLKDHKHTPTNRTYPVMLAAVVDAVGELKAVHRTYLALTGSGSVVKADIERPKMTLGAIGGFSCQLSPSCKTRMVICEGIETGLSIAQEKLLPVWCALSAGNMEKIVLPSDVREVIICADHDEPGLKSAEKTLRRLKAEGRKARIVVPKEVGTDFNDEFSLKKSSST